ncbi:hydrolase [Lysinibacillus xylanilyticus]|uniref:hydrolase n=1 Tax=Lysinibacillus xylanilyticus TaxID=582475 RepID=UPI0010D7053F
MSDIRTKSNCDSCGKKERKSMNHCKGCVCNQLRTLQTSTVVDLFIFGRNIEDVIFISFDPNNCCAFFNDPTTEPGSTIIVDCQDIQAIRIPG